MSSSSLNWLISVASELVFPSSSPPPAITSCPHGSQRTSWHVPDRVAFLPKSSSGLSCSSQKAHMALHVLATAHCLIPSATTALFPSVTLLQPSLASGCSYDTQTCSSPSRSITAGFFSGDIESNSPSPLPTLSTLSLLCICL